MPPKKDAPSKKTVEKKKEKIIEVIRTCIWKRYVSLFVIPIPRTRLLASKIRKARSSKPLSSRSPIRSSMVVDKVLPR